MFFLKVAYITFTVGIGLGIGVTGAFLYLVMNYKIHKREIRAKRKALLAEHAHKQHEFTK